MKHDEPRIRTAESEDVRVIETITHQAYSKWVQRIGREPLPMTVDYEARVSDHRFDLIEIGHEVVGLIETVPKVDYLLIENVAVLPEFQKQGIGRRLLDHAEQIAQQLELHELRLYTNELFEGNVALYESLGYKVLHRVEVDRGARADMAKTL